MAAVLRIHARALRLPLAALALTTGCAGAPGPAAEPAAPARVAAAPTASPRLVAMQPPRRDKTVQLMSEYFPTRIVARGGAIQPLEAAPRSLSGLGYQFEGARYTIDQFFERNHSSGMVVVHGGKVHYERYRPGSDRTTRFHGFSVTKSISSTLVGLAIQDGHIASVADPLTKYIPELAGTAYDGVTVKQALQMSSGVRFDEDYANPKSDIYVFSMRSMVSNQVPANELLKGLPRAAEPGSAFNYSTAESQVLAWLVREATGRSPAEYLSDRLWKKLGMEHDALWVLDRDEGMEMGGIGMNVAVRDYARFGLLMLHDGVHEGERLLPVGWTQQASTPDAPHIAYGALPWGEAEGYGYQWWAIDGPDRSYTAEGVFGQLVYVNPARGVVIAKTSTWPVGWDNDLKAEAWVAFDAIARHLEP